MKNKSVVWQVSIVSLIALVLLFLTINATGKISGIRVVGYVVQETNNHYEYVFTVSPKDKREFCAWLQKYDGDWYALVLLKDTNSIHRLEQRGYEVLKGMNMPFRDHHYKPGPDLWPFYVNPTSFRDGAGMRSFGYEPKQGFLAICKLTPAQKQMHHSLIQMVEKELKIVEDQLQAIERARQ